MIWSSNWWRSAGSDLTSRFARQLRQHLEPRAGLLVTALIALAFASLYLLSLYPGLGGRVHYGDSAEFQQLAAVTGVPHPSGYPLYLLLLKLFVRAVPFLTPARAATAFSAIAGAGAVLVVYMAAVRFSRSRLGGLTAALLLGVSYSFWAASTEAEVYALFHLLFGLVVYLLLRFRETKDHRELLLALFLYALGFGVHLLMIVLLPAIAYLLVRTEPRAFVSPRLIASVAAFIVIGMAPYLYLYYISNFVPGAPVNTLGAGRSFLEVLAWGSTVREFGGSMFAFSLRQLLSQRALVSFGYVLEEFSLPGLLLVGYGVCAAVASRYRSVSTAFLLLASIAYLFFITGYDAPDVQSLCVGAYIPLLVVASSVFSSGRGRAAKCALLVSAATISLYSNVAERGMTRQNNEPMGRIALVARSVPKGAALYLGRRLINFHTDFALSYLEATGELGGLRFPRDTDGAPGVVYATTEGKGELGALYAWRRRGGVTIAEFAQRHRSEITVWVVQDAEEHRPGPQAEQLFEAAGSSLYGSLQSDTGYVAVMVGPRIVFEASQPHGQLAVTETTSRQLVPFFGNSRFSFVSTTFGAMKPSFAGFRQGPRSSIRVNGAEYSPGLRGINVVAFDSQLVETESRTFDTTAGVDDSSDSVFRGLRRTERASWVDEGTKGWTRAADPNGKSYLWSVGDVDGRGALLTLNTEDWVFELHTRESTVEMADLGKAPIRVTLLGPKTEKRPTVLDGRMLSDQHGITLEGAAGPLHDFLTDEENVGQKVTFILANNNERLAYSFLNVNRTTGVEFLCLDDPPRPKR